MSIGHQVLDRPRSPAPPTAPAAPTAPASTGLRRRLLEALESREVAYVPGDGAHRRNGDCAREEAADRGLQLLVPLDRAPQFESVLASLGFKRTLDPVGGSAPWSFQFAGWDADEDGFVLLHVRYQPAADEDGPDLQPSPEAPRRRRSALAAAWLPPLRLLWRLWPTPAGPKRPKQLAAKGAIVAVVGADGAGKSTLISHSAAWLGEAFEVHTVHAGRPPATWATLPFKAPLALNRLAQRLRGRREESPPDAANSGLAPSPPRRPSLAYAVRAVVLAFERRQLLARCGRLAAAGRFVVCDRYPSDRPGAMDSPRLRVDPGRRGLSGAIANRLARMEARLYADIPSPHVALRVMVSLETAKQRNRTRGESKREDESCLEARHRQNLGWQKTGTRHVHDINADGTLADTVRMVKEAVWRSI